MKNNLSAFRESFRGYNKDDVNTYIADQNEKFTDMEADYKKELSELRAENSRLLSNDYQLAKTVEKLNEAKKASAEFKTQLDEALQREAELTSELDACKKQSETVNADEQDEAKETIARLQSSLSGSEAVIATLNEENAKLKEQCNQLRESSALTEESKINDKAQIYDQISQQIGSLIIDARSKADDTVKRAQESADEIVSKATEEADEVRRRADEYADRVQLKANERLNQTVTTINDTLRKLTEDCVSDYSQRLSICKASIDSLISEFHSTSEQANLYMEELLKTRGEELSSMLNVDEVTSD